MGVPVSFKFSIANLHSNSRARLFFPPLHVEYILPAQIHETLASEVEVWRQSQTRETVCLYKMNERNKFKRTDRNVKLNYKFTEQT